MNIKIFCINSFGSPNFEIQLVFRIIRSKARISEIWSPESATKYFFTRRGGGGGGGGLTIFLQIYVGIVSSIHINRCCWMISTLMNFFIGGGYYFPGKWLRNMSRVVLDNLSGNTISKLMIKSPRLPGSLGKGSPLLTMRLTVEGLTISSWRLTIILSPPKSGTSTLDPQRACKKRGKKY